MSKEIIEKAQLWLNENIDADTRKHVQYLIENDVNELTESFYRNLEFGTGGLRGIMGVGTNRMNKYTVAMATQGLANYMKKTYPGEKVKAAIAYDTRNNSRFFAQVTAEVLSANNIQVYLFDDIHPTPLLSFAVRELSCHTGIVITASHNPKEYNGYKVYGADGGQLIAPHDKNVINEVNLINGLNDVNFSKKAENIIHISKEIDELYVAKVKAASLSPEIIKQNKGLKIVYTPLHGTGVHLVPRCLKEYGFSNIIPVEAQCIPDGNFPTLEYPNPEEAKALTLAIEKARAVDADLVMATDPDADRVGVACKNNKGEFILFNGNQTASVLIHYILSTLNERKELKVNNFIVKTIVTTELLAAIARYHKVEVFDVLTGFKFIADIIKKYEGKKQFIAGGEESYGYLIGDFVRDKDAVISCCFIAEATAWGASQNKSFYDLLLDVYMQYGFYKEHLVSITKKGMKGSEEIALMMKNYRTTPPTEINGIKVTEMLDYKSSIAKHLINGLTKNIDLPKSDVLQFILADETKITVRPSGTEPKIKFYFSVKGELKSKDEFDTLNTQVDKRIKDIITSMNLH